MHLDLDRSDLTKTLASSWPQRFYPQNSKLLLSHLYTDISFTYTCKLAWYLRYLVIYCNYTPSRSSKAVSFMHIIPLLVMTRIIFAHQVFSIIMCQGSCPMLLVGTFHAWKYDSHPFPWKMYNFWQEASWLGNLVRFLNTTTWARQPTMGQSGWHLANNLFPLLHIKGRCIFEDFKYAEILAAAQFVSVICREVGFARCLSSLWAFAASGTSQACCNFNSWFQHAKFHNKNTNTNKNIAAINDLRTSQLQDGGLANICQVL